MKRLLPFLSILLVLNACKKEKSSTSTTNNNPTSTSPYYFKFTFNGINYNLNANFPQYMPFNAYEAGGYQVADASLYPSVGLRLSWPATDTVTESDLMGLKGKTLHFSDTTVRPQLSFSKDAISDPWYSSDTANGSYFVKITDIAYLKKDTTLGYYVKTYVITGTCSAVISQGTNPLTFTGGQFSFVISRRDL